MGGGLLELQHIGNEEAYFLYNPEITFFKSVYRRFTNFALESIRNEFENSSILQHASEKKINCKLSRSGDLVKHVSLVFDLPALKSTDAYAVKWIPNIGCAIIKSIDFMIESQIVDQISGEWLYIYNELYATTEENQSFLNIVNHPEISANISSIFNSNDNYVLPGKRMTIPIPFWFCKSSGNNLPLVALSKNHIHIQITFRPLNELFLVRDKSNASSEWFSPPSSIQLSEFAVDMSPFTTIGTLDIHAELSVMYVFLEQNERQRITQQDIVYTLTNVQYVETKQLERNSYIIPLQVKHPMKEIIWFLQRDDVTLRNDWFNYTNFIDQNQTKFENILLNNNPLVINESNNKNILVSAGILLNKNFRLEKKHFSYFSKLQPHIFLKHKIQEGIYMYNFGLHPQNEEQPSGTCNASAFKNIDLTIDIINAPDSTFYNLKAFVVTYNQLRIMGGFGGLQFS